MSLLDVIKATLTASLWLSWMAILITCAPALFAFVIAPSVRRWHYAIAILSGGVTGEVCGVGSLFLSLWLSCQGHSPCNTAQGDMGLIVTVPVGSFLGTLLAIGWTWLTLRIPSKSPWASICRYSGPSRILNWSYAIAIQVMFWVCVTRLFARLMA